MGSFPSVIHGTFGDEKVAQSTKIGSFALGTRMVLPDGREFVHAKASATALIAGNLYQGKAGEANTIFIKDLATADAAVGATAVVVTMAGTVLAADVYDDGYIFFSAGSSSGSVYKVKTASSASSTGTSTVSLADNDKLVEAVAGGTTTAGMRKNEYDSVTITTGDTVGVNTLAGVATRDVTASYYCWLQRKGPAACLTDNTTPIVGIGVTASTTVDGAVGVAEVSHAAGTTAETEVSKQFAPIGYCMSVAASAEYSLVNLCLP